VLDRVVKLGFESYKIKLLVGFDVQVNGESITGRSSRRVSDVRGWPPRLEAITQNTRKSVPR
jgi:hypothetical protein